LSATKVELRHKQLTKRMHMFEQVLMECSSDAMLFEIGYGEFKKEFLLRNRVAKLNDKTWAQLKVLAEINND